MADTPKLTEAGKLYFGFICKNPKCGLPIVLGEILPEQLDAAGGVEIASSRSEHAITCRLCGHGAAYHHDELRRFQVSEKGKLH
jgi:hypothetical protein